MTNPLWLFPLMLNNIEKKVVRKNEDLKDTSNEKVWKVNSFCWQNFLKLF